MSPAQLFSKTAQYFQKNEQERKVHICLFSLSNIHRHAENRCPDSQDPGEEVEMIRLISSESSWPKRDPRIRQRRKDISAPGQSWKPHFLKNFPLNIGPDWIFWGPKDVCQSTRFMLG